ncbi:Pre-rRNA-processing protein TSR2-like [Hondaea fermentalgiana]|uniref:Pre-rRNA-processing protein TSR2-like n=1 Tax=Hondaea fermentalgiana TaxID=2315210 RepID=A0A2R5GWE5_9STRA|nr:Pre-rRNA-processing protein TSR2-like [Hondaea fermentalgiana]|eukprot:GBG32983.1 Pre-rRNA-processing protein TSR2-like [Hondaea fermentalgiana]
MDRPVRVRVAQERDWTAPASPLWFCFEAAVYKLLVEWDVMKMAVDGGWSDGDPYFERTKVVDDALANFALRAQAGGVDPQELADFLVDTMEDRFNAEIDAPMCAPLSQVVVRIFEESRTGTTTGLRHVLGDAGFEAAANEKQPLALISVPITMDQQVVASSADAGADSSQTNDQSAAASASSSDASAPAAGASEDKMQAEADNEAGTGAQQQQEEDDGWTTIPTKRRSNRVRNTYTVQATSNEDTSMQED